MNYSDLSPLYYACRQTTARIVRKLLEKGADPYVLYGKEGNTLLHEACDNNKMQVIPLLVTFGVDVNEANALSQTPLHIVCKKQYPEIIQYLLQNGADPMRQDKDGNTPLHLLVKETKPQTIDCIDLLLDNGADINAVNDLQRTPILRLCTNNRQSVPQSQWHPAEPFVGKKGPMPTRRISTRTILYTMQ